MTANGYVIASKKGTVCPYKPIICSSNSCQDCQIYTDWVGHERTMGRVASPEKEQSDRLAQLRIQIEEKRNVAFFESAHGSPTKKLQFAAQVDAFDLILGLINKEV